MLRLVWKVFKLQNQFCVWIFLFNYSIKNSYFKYAERCFYTNSSYYQCSYYSYYYQCIMFVKMNEDDGLPYNVVCLVSIKLLKSSTFLVGSLKTNKTHHLFCIYLLRVTFKWSITRYFQMYKLPFKPLFLGVGETLIYAKKEVILACYNILTKLMQFLIKKDKGGFGIFWAYNAF